MVTGMDDGPVPLPLSEYDYGLTAPSADLGPMPLAPAPEPEPLARSAPRHLQPQPVAAAPPALAPVPTAPRPPSRAWAGLTLVAAALAGGLGYRLGGGWGAAAGALYVGGARNALRTCRTIGSDTAEATKSGTVALFGLAGAGYMTYRAAKARSESSG